MKAVYALKKRVRPLSDEVFEMGRTDFYKVEHYFFEGTKEEHEEFQRQLLNIGTPVGSDTLLLGNWDIGDKEHE